MVDLAGGVEEEARGRRIRPSAAAAGGPGLIFFDGVELEQFFIFPFSFFSFVLSFFKFSGTHAAERVY